MHKMVMLCKDNNHSWYQLWFCLCFLIGLVIPCVSSSFSLKPTGDYTVYMYTVCWNSTVAHFEDQSMDITSGNLTSQYHE